VNARVSVRSLDKALASGVSPSADVCVLLPAADRPSDTLTRFLDEAPDRACATLVIPSSERQDYTNTSTAGPGDRLAEHRLTPGGWTAPEPLNADELTGRIKALCDIGHPLRKMREELNRLRRNQGQRQISSEFAEQLRLDSQIQNDLLPHPMIDTGPLSIRTLYMPADFVSGDTYDIVRLDEDRFGFSIADATGHGLPAALVAILVKNSLRGKEIVNGSYHIIEPDDLLRRLNRELIAAQLQQCHFITALNAIFDQTTNQIRWARGGVPYPILIRPGQPPRQMRSVGGLIGAFQEQNFEVITHRFEPGDMLLFYTDGLEAFLVGKNVALGSEAILDTDWIKQLAAEGPDASLDEIKNLAANRTSSDWSQDDITALVLQMS